VSLWHLASRKSWPQKLGRKIPKAVSIVSYVKHRSLNSSPFSQLWEVLEVTDYFILELHTCVLKIGEEFSLSRSKGQSS
jgi:hypothetical protein